MTKRFGILPVFLVALLLAGCSAALQSTTPTVQPNPTKQSAATAPVDLARMDEQGAVSVIVTPLNLDEPGQTLEFEVGLETHSVDLSMDLTKLATLTTDTGLSVQATAWDGPRGGHHVSGKLSFPTTNNSASSLKDAKELTLTLRDVDAPERVFKWEFSK